MEEQNIEVDGFAFSIQKIKEVKVFSDVNIEIFLNSGGWGSIKLSGPYAESFLKQYRRVCPFLPGTRLRLYEEFSIVAIGYVPGTGRVTVRIGGEDFHLPARLFEEWKG